MYHNQAAGKKADYGNQRGQLQIAQARDGVARGTAASISGTKADQKTAYEQ